jgi:serine racemase
MAPGDPPLDALVVPVGGGGLVSGCAIVCKALWPEMLVVGAEPECMDDAFQSKAQGVLLGNPPGCATSVADGLRTQLGPNTWPIVRDLVDSIVTVCAIDIFTSDLLKIMRSFFFLFLVDPSLFNFMTGCRG